MYMYPDVTPVLSRLSASVSEFQNERRVTGLCTHDNKLQLSRSALTSLFAQKTTSHVDLVPRSPA